VGDPARRFGDCPGPAQPAPIAAERSEAKRPLHSDHRNTDTNYAYTTTQQTGDPA